MTDYAAERALLGMFPESSRRLRECSPEELAGILGLVKKHGVVLTFPRDGAYLWVVDNGRRSETCRLCAYTLLCDVFIPQSGACTVNRRNAASFSAATHDVVIIAETLNALEWVRKLSKWYHDLFNNGFRNCLDSDRASDFAEHLTHLRVYLRQNGTPSAEAEQWLVDTLRVARAEERGCTCVREDADEDESRCDCGYELVTQKYDEKYLAFPRAPHDANPYPPGIAHAIAFCAFVACRGILDIYERLRERDESVHEPCAKKARTN